MGHIHHTTKCRNCNEVIIQCRCPDVDKPINWTICASCHSKQEMREYVMAIVLDDDSAEILKVYAINQQEAEVVAHAHYRLQGETIKEIQCKT